MFYCVVSELAVGTPPQPFNVILSLRQSDLFVLSSTCDDPNYAGRRHYDSAKSATYVENGTALNVSFWYSRGRGFISQDAIHIGLVSISDQNFVEARNVDTGASTYGVHFEGQLGLGPKYGNSTTGAGNLATSMYSQGLISKNIFSMMFSHAVDETGVLIFGGTNWDMDLDDVAMIPVTNVTGNSEWDTDVLTNAWQVSAGYIQLGSGIVVNKSLDGYTAWIQTEFPLIALPNDLADQLHTYMNAHQLGWSPLYGVDCDDRKNWPDLVLNLGGKDFRMSPYDYAQEFNEDGDKSCLSMFVSNGVSDGDEIPTIALGLGFLKAFQAVFDLERNMVGCEFLSSFLPSILLYF
jgi:saccharopepsin